MKISANIGASRKNGARVFLQLLMLMVFLLPASDSSAQSLEIVLHENAVVSSEDIALDQIAKISGGTPDVRSNIGRLIVARAPMRGQTTILSAAQIRRSLQRAGYDEGVYRLMGDQAVKASRASLAVSAERVCSAVREFILAKAPWPKEKMTIRPIRFNQTVYLPIGDLLIEVNAPKHNDWLGNVLFSIEFGIDGRKVKNISVPVTIEVLSTMVVAYRPLGKNQPITPNDIRVVEWNLAKAPVDAIVDPRMAIGRKTNRAIAADAILCSGQLDTLPILQSGDIVHIVAESSTMRISTQGMVKKNGAPGDRIQVMNLSSKKVVVAQVIDERTVRVDF
jgi:flagella basal body P-ring formation protein FlgA